MMRIKNPILAWNFDKHVHSIGTHFENLMREDKMTPERAIKRLEEGNAPVKRTINQVGATIGALLQASQVN